MPTPPNQPRTLPADPLLGRRALVGGAVAVAAVALLPHDAAAQRQTPNQGIKRWPKPPQGKRNPRFVKRKVIQVSVKLETGFYLNPRSKVVHYVTKQGKIRRVQRINVRRLKPLTTADVVKLLLDDPQPRVHLATASRALEEAAWDHFQANEHETAFQLLATAIRHDRRFKRGHPEMPSLRLYDLFAAQAARLGDSGKLSELARLAQESQRQVARPAQPTVQSRRAPRASRQVSEFRRWQIQRKTESKAAALKARPQSFTTRVKKWNAARSSETEWVRSWQSGKRTWKL